MILKYADGVDPFRGEFLGGVYQRYAAGEQMMSTKKNDRYPYALQWQRASTLIGITRYWRMLTDGERAAWNTFAATYPQPTQWNPARFLNGYNLFCRWNFFNRLVNGQATPLLTTPAMSVVADSTLTPTITNSGGQLVLDATWSRSGQDIWAAVFISRIVSAGVNYIASQPRFIVGIENGGGTSIKFGSLYNWYVSNDARKITSSDDWIIPNTAQWLLLLNHFDPSGTNGLNNNTVANSIRNVSPGLWSGTVIGANSFGLNVRGHSYRTAGGTFYLTTLPSNRGWFLNSQVLSSATANIVQFSGPNPGIYAINTSSGKRYGFGVRLIKSAVGVPNGTLTTYIGNDNKVYSAVAVNGYYWTKDNSIETKFRNGDLIPEVQNNVSWSKLSTAALCYFQNDINNSFISSPSIFDISSEYSNMFGRLPVAGENVLINIIKFNKVSGQFLPEQKFFITVA